MAASSRAMVTNATVSVTMHTISRALTTIAPFLPGNTGEKRSNRGQCPADRVHCHADRGIRDHGPRTGGHPAGIARARPPYGHAQSRERHSVPTIADAPRGYRPAKTTAA